MKINGIEIENAHICRIEQDAKSLHLIIEDSISDEKYDEYCEKLSTIYPNIIDVAESIMWYPITIEKFTIEF